ncbi:MAG: type II secretion system protein [Candidatus Saccharimonadales bacterium]
MKITCLSRSQNGASLVEVLIAIALAGIMLPTLALALITANSSVPSSNQQLQASGLLREAVSAIQVVRQKGWGGVVTNGTYHPVVSSNSWVLASGAETIGSLTRKIVISDSQRDATGQLVASSGTVDPSTKLATIIVSWSKPRDGSLSNQLYLTHWQNQTSWSQTTAADFTGDTHANLTITSTSDGEVQLTAPKTSATLTSSIFDAGPTAAFNYFNFDTSQPTKTYIKFRIAVSNTKSGWVYVGPNGATNSYFTSPGQIPLARSTGRYVRYRAYFGGTATVTPILSSVTINYSKATP